MYRRKTIVVVLIASLAVLGTYAVFNPATSRFAPKCAFKTLTGYDCPSCGGQRAAHALLNGRVEEAFMLNPFLFLAIPYLVAVTYAAFSKSRFALAIKPIVHHPVAIGFYLVLYVVWWIVRNTPLWQS
ncbi:MAG: DUF2752 domain-containing protein [Tidjanibacter sp.]|nr:DUF2752 domain-containing protein [Tidjanibacter sp.]